MANRLLAKRDAGQVSINWPTTFIRRTLGIKPHINWLYDWQQALCKDPEIISKWFILIEHIKAKYGITDDDSYNFNKTGF